jgi:GNAT superfamily N-acetyltransferase
MSTHLYCILPPTSLAALPPGLTGIGDAAVRALDVGRMVAWVSDTQPRRLSVPYKALPDAAVAGIREHDTVVEAALAIGVTPVPARFGQRFTNDEACAEGIGRHAGAIAALLSAVQGLVEMTLILAPSTKRVVADLIPVLPEMVGEGAGRRYLDALQAREAATGTVRQALDALAQRLTEAAQEFVQRVSVHENLAKMPMRAISHLIARDVVDRYSESVRAVHPTADYRFLVVGPRAPYSFATITSSDGGSHGLRLAEP